MDIFPLLVSLFTYAQSHHLLRIGRGDLIPMLIDIDEGVCVVAVFVVCVCTWQLSLHAFVHASGMVHTVVYMSWMICMRLIILSHAYIEGGRRVQTALLWQQGDQSVSPIDFAVQMVKDMDLPYSFMVRLRLARTSCH